MHGATPLTWPVWIDRSMPTPPPWWIDTHVAPLAVLTSASSSGQSVVASDPSAIASVSRYGEAAEPVSRWSRPMTTGALISPDATSSSNRSPASDASPREGSCTGD